MRVAISGSSGLIGGGIHRQLAKTKKVTSIGRRRNCEINVDFSRPESVKNINLHGFDAVIHCAGVVDEDFKVNPISAYVQNTLGLSMFVQRACECGVRDFIYFSTAHVYGPLVGSISEITTVNPLSNYAIAHYAAEQIIKSYSINNGIKALVLRPVAVFGMPIDLSAFDRWSLIPFSFPLEAVYTRKIVLRSSGEQSRNFIGTDDLALYAERFIETSDRFDPFTVINPIGPNTLSIYEFAVKCAQIYTGLTDQKCEVIRALTSVTDSQPRFSYESKNRYHKSLQSLDKYLIDFTEMAIDAHKEGHKYGK
jgi:UDP-glucose 4-epimerase